MRISVCPSTLALASFVVPVAIKMLVTPLPCFIRWLVSTEDASAVYATERSERLPVSNKTKERVAPIPNEMRLAAAAIANDLLKGFEVLVKVTKSWLINALNLRGVAVIYAFSALVSCQPGWLLSLLYIRRQDVSSSPSECRSSPDYFLQE